MTEKQITLDRMQKEPVKCRPPPSAWNSARSLSPSGRSGEGPAGRSAAGTIWPGLMRPQAIRPRRSGVCGEFFRCGGDAQHRREAPLRGSAGGQYRMFGLRPGLRSASDPTGAVRRPAYGVPPAGADLRHGGAPVAVLCGEGGGYDWGPAGTGGPPQPLPAAPRDDTSDCEVCEAGLTARFMLALGREDEAVDIAVELLKQGKYCGEEPWTLLAILTEDGLNRRDLDVAERYATAMLIQPVKRPADLRRAGTLLRMEAAFGAGRGSGSNCWQGAFPGRRTSGTSGFGFISIWGRRSFARPTAHGTPSLSFPLFRLHGPPPKTACMTAPPWHGGSGTRRRRWGAV